MAHQHTLKVDTELIGDFRIIDLLGSGGFANTYLAEDLTLGRQVAIKEFFPSELAVRADSQSVSVKSASQKVQFDWAKGRFVREAKTLAKFRHPSVVRVFRVFNANDTAYIVLEFVRGANMETWLKRIQRRPDQDELDHFLPPLLDALEVVHDAGILHRDIKPANIYIREVERTPVLLDFGAAKYAASSAGDQTATTAAIVSKGYSPHEAYSTDAQLQGPWTDIYGLAATLHRALTGSAPMESTTRIMQDDFVPLGDRPELAGRYRPEFLDSLNRALAVMPRDRPHSIAEWRKELYPNLAASTASGAAAGPQAGGADWHPLSDTPSADATTIYTGGSALPSATQASPSRSHTAKASGIGTENSDRPSLSRGAIAIASEVSSITEATRLAVNRVTKGASRAVLTGWALAATGAAGLALPLIFNTMDHDVSNAGVATPTQIQAASPVAATPRVTAAPTPPAARSSGGMSTGEDPDVQAAMKKFEIEREKSRVRERAVAKQRAEWQRERLALQAEAARKKAEDLSKLAARRTAERKAQEQEKERQRLAKLAEDKRQRQAEERLAAQRAADERAKAQKAAAEKALAQERERKRIAAQKAEQERQRLAAEKTEREARRKATEAALEQERQRLARRAAAAEKARTERAKREAQRKADEARKYAALNPTPPFVDKPEQLDRKPYLKKVQTALKDRKCYSGSVNGELKDTETALGTFSKAYEGKAKSLNLQTASADEYDAWLTWFQSLEKFGCITPGTREEIAKPKPTWKKRKTRKTTRKKQKSGSSKKRKKAKSKKSKSSKSASRKRSKSKPSYGAGSSSRSLLRGSR